MYKEETIDELTPANIAHVFYDNLTYIAELSSATEMTLLKDNFPLLTSYKITAQDIIEACQDYNIKLDVQVSTRKNILGTNDFAKLIRFKTKYSFAITPADCKIKCVVITDSSRAGNYKKEEDAHASTQSLTTEQYSMINRTLDNANKIWNDVNDSFKNAEFLALSPKEQLSLYRQRHSNFYRQHPVAIRYMIELQKFSSSAFKKYLERVVTAQIGNQEVWLKLQADYDGFLQRELYKLTKKQSKKRWDEVYKTLKDESTEFKKMQDEADAQAKEIEARVLNDYRQELHDQIINLQNNDSEREKLIRDISNDAQQPADCSPPARDFSTISLSGGSFF